MARIYPFSALRYNPAKVRLDDAVTQPYDKINPSLQQAYYQRSPYNLVRIILGLRELFDNDGNNVYTRAGDDFRQWRRQGVLLPDSEPSLYAYSQTAAVPGRPGHLQERRGFIALSDAVEYSEGIVFRHEKTLAKPKSDRLDLLRATRAHFGQIFMLYSDPAHTAEKLLFGAGNPPEVEVTDDYSVVHRLWRISEPPVINMVTAAMADKKLIIADGHHRYETALAYANERRPADAAPRVSRGVYQAPAYPEAAVMMTFINMDSPGLTILPTHRVVHGLTDFSEEKFLTKAREYFDVTPLRADAIPSQSLSLDAPERSACSRFFVATAQASYLLTSHTSKIAAALPNLSDRQRKLDVAQLHGILLEQVLGLSQESIAQQTNLRYVRDPEEAIAMVRDGQAQIAFLLQPVSLDQLRDIALAGEVMPQKSTDFYPKLLSGLTIYALD
jgi:uncharacterized protein (DUF1015 family)